MCCCLQTERYPRQCPRLDEDGEPCRYDAPSLSAFRRHLVVRHGTALSIRGRGRVAYECYTQIEEDELRRRRAYISCRQGGRGAFRRQLDVQYGVRNSWMPGDISPERSVGYGPHQADDMGLSVTSDQFDDDGMSTTWVAENLPDLSNPNFEIGSLCVTVPTAEASAQASTEVRSVGVDARPPFAVSTHGHDASVQTTNHVRSVGTDARPMPCPWLSPPDVPTRSLASAVADVVSARPETPSDVIADELCSSMTEASLPQRRAVQLAVDFGLQFNAQMAERLLNRMSSHSATSLTSSQRRWWLICQTSWQTG